MCLLLILSYVLQRSKKDSRTGTFHHLIIIFGAVLLLHWGLRGRSLGMVYYFKKHKKYECSSACKAMNSTEPIETIWLFEIM